jgi:hypothetical protein
MDTPSLRASKEEGKVVRCGVGGTSYRIRAEGLFLSVRSSHSHLRSCFNDVVMELLLCGSVLPASRIPALKVGRGESSESCPNPAKVGADHMTASSIEARAGRAGRAPISAPASSNNQMFSDFAQPLPFPLPPPLRAISSP